MPQRAMASGTLFCRLDSSIYSKQQCSKRPRFSRRRYFLGSSLLPRPRFSNCRWKSGRRFHGDRCLRGKRHFLTDGFARRRAQFGPTAPLDSRHHPGAGRHCPQHAPGEPAIEETGGEPAPRKLHGGQELLQSLLRQIRTAADFLEFHICSATSPSSSPMRRDRFGFQQQCFFFCSHISSTVRLCFFQVLCLYRRTLT